MSSSPWRGDWPVGPIRLMCDDRDDDARDGLALRSSGTRLVLRSGWEPERLGLERKPLHRSQPTAHPHYPVKEIGSSVCCARVITQISGAYQSPPIALTDVRSLVTWGRNHPPLVSQAAANYAGTGRNLNLPPTPQIHSTRSNDPTKWCSRGIVCPTSNCLWHLLCLCSLARWCLGPR